ncbi:unnamed protein product [Cylindrotheca closterium]|uniref:Vacuolar ATPase assembly protein VMA22 n=1 Tax=Cylindrotheca closterium TaxID=2856 RepID=A0AAD2JIG4_9STRA|nr:unnamed protein product [Cylindrotheca closterium]
MEVLKHLEVYSKVTEDANKSLKSSCWHLTKSRKRYQGGFLASVDSSYSAGDLREEFSALSVLETAEPALQEESDNVENIAGNAIAWRLVDVAEAKEREEAKTQRKNDTGLRQRNQKENQVQAKPSIQKDDLKSIDPLSLFGGLAPQDLRQAQKNAKQALAKYIDAANEVAAIQQLIATKL